MVKSPEIKNLMRSITELEFFLTNLYNSGCLARRWPKFWGGGVD
jgi:hypothetical protein